VKYNLHKEDKMSKKVGSILIIMIFLLVSIGIVMAEGKGNAVRESIFSAKIVAPAIVKVAQPSP
jgi:hypothetical protein